MSRKFQLWFCLTMGVPYFVYALVKIAMYLIDVFVYKIEAFSSRGFVYVFIQFLFMIAAGFVIRLGLNELRVKRNDGDAVTKK